jgi:hypothetical protein
VTVARPHWRRLPLFLLGAFLAAVAAGLALMIPARQDLEAARNSLQEGRQAVVEGRTAAASRDFTAAREAFESAHGKLGNPLTAFVGTLPVVGRTPGAAVAIAQGGELVARAGEVVTGALADVPGGLTGLLPEGGTIPVGRLSELASPIHRAAGLVARAEATAARAPASWVLPPVAGPFDTFRSEVTALGSTFRGAAALAREVPAFLGSKGTRRYFFGAQNPAELRGTGGLIGAYSILTVEGGRFHLGPFRSITTLPDVEPSEIEPPGQDYGRLYDRYGGAGFWRNINMTPDFPSAATAIERLYERVTGDGLDGTILADPQALASLMEVTGPVLDPATGRQVEAEDVVSFVTNEAYAIHTDPGSRKRILGAMAGRVVAGFLGGDWEDPEEAVGALGDAVGGGHILLHAADPAVQRAFEVAGVAGRLPGVAGDHLSVVVNNAGGNKVDFYARRTVRYEVHLLPGGQAEAVATVTYVNAAPAEGQPAYVIGPYPGVSRAGESVMIAATYCGTCEVHTARRDGRSTGVALEEELGHTVMINEVRVPSGGRSELVYGWTVPEAWSGGPGGGTYRLTFRGQPTITPTQVEVVVVAPPGMRILRTGPEMEITGDRASWRGEAGHLLSFDVAVAAPLALRVLLFGAG